MTTSTDAKVKLIKRRKVKGVEGEGSIFILFSFSNTMHLKKKADGDIINLEFQGHKQELRQQMGVFRNVQRKNKSIKFRKKKMVALKCVVFMRVFVW